MSDEEQKFMPLLTGQADILGKCKSAFCHAIKEKFSCTAILHNVEEAISFGSNTSGVWHAEKRYSKKLSSRVEVSVWKDDLTRHKVVAVVNAANEKLNHGGGLALALSVAGGPKIQQWSNEILKQYGRVKTSNAVITPAGNLPCECIIHAVGPKVPQNPSQKEVDQAAPLLNDTVINILQTVVNQKMTSVAIPALSSGLFNFPRDRCADIIVKAIKQFQDFGGFQDKNLEIHLVNNDEPTVREMERATRAILDPTSSSASYSGVVKGQNQSMTSSSSNSFKFENITLRLKQGSIQEEEVDVIVNTIAPDCDLSQGLISKAILMKAGGKIQDEISRKKYASGFTRANLYVTKGYDLNCKAVFHTVCSHRSESKATEILYKVVWDCLKKATSEYKSISFPAIGTGNLGFKKWEVAGIMIKAVAEFARQNTKKRLDVNLVVFAKDNEMMEAFENEMKSRKREAKSPEVHNGMTSFGSAAKETAANEIPTVELISSDSKEALREAKLWIYNILNPSDSITIKNNHVIYLDQGDHENLLSLQAKFHVHITEFFRNGNGGITITGNPSDVSCVAIEVESMLCKAQEDFAQAEERDMLYSVVRWSCKDVPWIQTPENSAVLEKAYLAGNENYVFNKHKVNLINKTLVADYGKSSKVERTCLLALFKPDFNSFYRRVPVYRNDYGVNEASKSVNACGLHIIKMEKLENIPLKQLFAVNGQRVKNKPKQLYQRVSAQFCDLICRVGFQKEFAPPAEQKYGSGIYFSSTVDGAMKLWREPEDEQYIYIIQAQVLTGKSTTGSPECILPPPLNGDPLDRFDSLSDMGQKHVIFSGQQALPEYLFICARSTHV